MAEIKPMKETAAWLFTADRYVVEITEAERVKALAATVKRLKGRPVSRPVLRLLHGARDFPRLFPEGTQ